jgi:Skp family chaperone for outer membrane proteins
LRFQASPVNRPGSNCVIMPMRPLLASFFLTLLLSSSPFAQNGIATTSPATATQLSQDQIRDLIREAAEKDIENDKKQRDYTYIQREEEHKLDGNGQIKSNESRTYEIMVLYEEPVRKLIAKDDKPLSDSDARKEDEKVQKVIEKRKNDSESDRRKRQERQDKEREEGRQFVKEIADAYNFHFAGEEKLDGRETLVIDADPRPGYEPHMKDAKFLPRFRFRVWVDQAEKQWVKLDIQCIDTVSVGLFLLRVHKGSNIQIEQVRVNDEVWLPRHVSLKLDARLALLKGLNISEDVTFRDYRKFRTDTRIVPVGELQEQH